MSNPFKELIKRFPAVAKLMAERDFLRKTVDERDAELAAARAERDRYKTWVPPGHFYSPLNTEASIREREAEIFPDPPPRALTGLELNETGQLELLGAIESAYPALPWDDEPREGLRYHYDNENYSYFDAIALAGLLRHWRPRRIVEVGSGYSTALMLDVVDGCEGYEPEIVCVEPYPDVLEKLLSPADLGRVTLRRKIVQHVDHAVFEALGAGDLLFVDSSHVAKAGSDVCHLFFEVLPRLKAGVHVHFHDVIHPFEYSKEFVYWGISWNEAYLLRAFLLYNEAFRIEFMNSYVGIFQRKRLERTMPLALKNTGGSIYLTRA